MRKETLEVLDDNARRVCEQTARLFRPPDTAITPDLSRAEVRAHLTRCCRRTIAAHIVIVLSRGPIDRAFGGWIGMFCDALEDLCAVTSYSADQQYREDAHNLLPRLACHILLDELRGNPELQDVERKLVADAFYLLSRRRGAPHEWRDEPSYLAELLALQLHLAAAAPLAAWSASPPPEARSIAVARLWLMLGPRAGIDRQDEFREWRNRQRAAGRPVSVERFCAACNTSKTRLHANWLNSHTWTDDSPEGALVIEQLSRPVASWPERNPG